jgi:hypothetical protein
VHECRQRAGPGYGRRGSPGMERASRRRGRIKLIGFAQMCAPPQSMATAVSSPMTQASWPGGNTFTSPGPISSSVPVRHADPDPSREHVLEMRRFAKLGACYWLDVLRPTPARLDDQPANLAAPDLDDLRTSMRKLAHFVRSVEVLPLCFCHSASSRDETASPRRIPRGRQRLTSVGRLVPADVVPEGGPHRGLDYGRVA